jgi:sterol-4alpha-carboxylate 3-dehydrogenase (decarboxylating)
LIEAGKKGQSRFMLGNGKNLMDWTYVQNLSDAHVLAAIRLYDSADSVGGQVEFFVYFIPFKNQKFNTKFDHHHGHFHL